MARGKTGGRKKGTPNKTTWEFRETVKQLLEDNADNVKLWLSQVALTDPDKALDKLIRLAEYAAPKLARTEISGELDHRITGYTVTVQRAQKTDNADAD